MVFYFLKFAALYVNVCPVVEMYRIHIDDMKEDSHFMERSRISALSLDLIVLVAVEMQCLYMLSGCVTLNKVSVNRIQSIPELFILFKFALIK